MDLQQLQQIWTSPKTQTGALQAKIWDAKAAEYEEKPLPTPEDNPFLNLFLEKVKPTPSMSILDVGCGAGQYTLALARQTGEAIGADVSSGMLAAAQKRAKALGLSNTKFICQDWATADIDALGFRRKFDAVFAHMTPAVSDYDTTERFFQCSKSHCFLVKPCRRHDQVQDAAFSLVGIHSQKQRMDDMIPNTFHYLWLQGCQPELSYRESQWRNTQSLEAITNWCVDRAKLQKTLTAAEEQKIQEYLKEIAVDGQVTETVTTTIATIYWHV